MKKIYTTPQYKVFHKRHIERANRRRTKKRKKRRFQKVIPSHPIPTAPHVNRPKAPVRFCIKDNPEEVIRFVNKLNKYLKERKAVFVDLSAIEFMSHDAIVVLLSIMYQFKKNNIPFNGNFPKNTSCRKTLNESGFLNSLYKEKSIRYDTNDTQHKNIIRKHGNDTSGDIAKELIKICSENIWGKPCRCQGVYRILMELMQNTHTHANRDIPGAEDWWLSVNYDSIGNKECFSFVDYGIGVFSSLENKKPGSIFFGMLDRLKNLFGPSDADVFSAILKGELHRTATGKYYRGKGLPGIKEALNRNQISNLYIITNDAYADVCANKFVSLSNPLEGTFIYWELTQDNHKCDDNETQNIR